MDKAISIFFNKIRILYSVCGFIVQLAYFGLLILIELLGKSDMRAPNNFLFLFNEQTVWELYSISFQILIYNFFHSYHSLPGPRPPILIFESVILVSVIFGGEWLSFCAFMGFINNVIKIIIHFEHFVKLSIKRIVFNDTKAHRSMSVYFLC